MPFPSADLEEIKSAAIGEDLGIALGVASGERESHSSFETFYYEQ
jgi:hypothetical protein